jgi:hypothetical protein
MNEISTIIVFIIFVLFFTIIILIINEHSELFLEYRVAKKNNKTYGIQEEFNESTKALELLASLHEEMDKFVIDLKKRNPNDERVTRLVNGMKRVKIEEAPNDDGSSYTINKGELMALCLRHKTGNHQFHDYNTLQFVMIHEMAHIASISEGHNQEFINNFRFLLREAKALGYYEPVNYSNSPINYCGIKVTNNPYY